MYTKLFLLLLFSFNFSLYWPKARRALYHGVIFIVLQADYLFFPVCALKSAFLLYSYEVSQTLVVIAFLKSLLYQKGKSALKAKN